MKFFSPSQTEIYESAKAYILRRLEQILERSNSSESQTAFFFTLKIMLTKDTEVVGKIIDIFYENKLIKRFLMDLNGWLKAENNNSKFIKSITDTRLIPTDKQNPQHIKNLQLEFAVNVKNDTTLFLLTTAPKTFETTYLMLCKKYAEIIKPDYTAADTRLGGA